MIKEGKASKIETFIKKHGGCIVYEGDGYIGTAKWEMTDDFENDIRVMWAISNRAHEYWNSQIAVFARAASVCERASLNVRADIESIKNGYVFKRRSIIKPLIKHGLLTRCEEKGGMLNISFKNKQVKRCLTKSGQALEMAVYLFADKAEDNGEKVYDEVMTGVVIDWDGEILNSATDVRNEIDAVMLHRETPVFVSCKSGAVDSNELYKLRVVAEKFGGEEAKTALITYYLGDTPHACSLRNRAEEMNIKIVEYDSRTTEDEIINKIKRLWV